jgi:hypothetical protein
VKKTLPSEVQYKKRREKGNSQRYQWANTIEHYPNQTSKREKKKSSKTTKPSHYQTKQENTNHRKITTLNPRIEETILTSYQK